MRRWVLVLLASACSLRFDPALAPPLACPEAPVACPDRDNAAVRCDGPRCVYTCQGGFVDADRDLDREAGSNGCEVACTSARPAPPAPARLVASAGLPGRIDWSWPAVGGDVAGYQLCESADAGTEECRELPLAVCAPDGGCTVSSLGLSAGTRRRARVRSVSACGTASTEGIPSTSLFVIDPRADAGWTLESGICTAAVTPLFEGFALEQTGLFCATHLLVGDELGSDYTVETELRFPGFTGRVGQAGLVYRGLASGVRQVVSSRTLEPADDFVTTLRLRQPFVDRPQARSVAALTADVWWRLRVAVTRSEVSVQLGPSGGALAEVLRLADEASAPARVGVQLSSALTAARVEFKDFSVRTEASLPPRGPRQVRHVLDSPDAGPGARYRGLAAPSFGPCPRFPAAADCALAGGCAPPAQATCARLGRAGQNGFLADLPPGLDTRLPWTLSVRFAPAADGGLFGGTLLGGVSGALLAWPTPGSDAGVRVLEQPTGLLIAADTWHVATFRFNPDAGTASLELDGVPRALPSASFPGGWERALGGISVVEGALEAHVAEVSLAQP